MHKYSQRPLAGEDSQFSAYNCSIVNVITNNI